jgi:hypothetical protein
MGGARGPTMVKSAHRYDFYPSLTDNADRATPDEVFDAVERSLVSRFGGLTSQQRDFPPRGIWQGQSELFLRHIAPRIYNQLSDRRA